VDAIVDWTEDFIAPTMWHVHWIAQSGSERTVLIRGLSQAVRFARTLVAHGLDARVFDPWTARVVYPEETTELLSYLEEPPGAY
jgi:hypothetical protein